MGPGPTDKVQLILQRGCLNVSRGGGHTHDFSRGVEVRPLIYFAGGGGGGGGGGPIVWIVV